MQFLQGIFIGGASTDRYGGLNWIPSWVCHASMGAMHDIFLTPFYRRYPPRMARGLLTFLRLVRMAVFVNNLRLFLFFIFDLRMVLFLLGFCVI